MKIGIDLDDTIWKFNEIFIEFYNYNYKTNYKMEECYDYAFDRLFDVSRDKVSELFDDFEKSNFFENIIFLDNFLDNFKVINKTHEVYFITARPAHTYKIILKRMRSFLGKIPRIYFVDDVENKIKKEKFEYCKDLGIDIMIDDGLHNLEPCAQEGIFGLLIDNPWNQKEILSNNIIRVSGWNEIKKEIERYENRKY